MTTSKGLNLLIYPSALINAGRLNKIAKSLQDTDLFSETHIVGIDNQANVSDTETVAPSVKLMRFRGPKLSSFLGGIRVMVFWPQRVFHYYKDQTVSAVAAQNVYLLPLAFRISKKTKAVLAYNAHELETETINSKGLKQKIAKWIERKYIYKADIISVVNDSIADWYEKEYPGIKRPIPVTNVPEDSGGRRNLRAELNIPNNELVFIHIGFLMPGRNIPLLLESFENTSGSHLVFLGEGPYRDTILESISKHSNIHLLKSVTPDQVVSVARGADVGICLIEPVSLSDRLSTPNKLMESLAANIPPLSSDLIEARRILGDVLANKWIINNPETDLKEKLKNINLEDISTFRKLWKKDISWHSEVAPLIEDYKEKISLNN